MNVLPSGPCKFEFQVAISHAMRTTVHFNSTLHTVTQRHSRLPTRRPPTLHTPPHSVWQRLEFGKLMNEAGGVLAPPGQLIHEAAGVLSRSPAHLNLERRH